MDFRRTEYSSNGLNQWEVPQRIYVSIFPMLYTRSLSRFPVFLSRGLFFFWGILQAFSRELFKIDNRADIRTLVFASIYRRFNEPVESVWKCVTRTIFLFIISVILFASQALTLSLVISKSNPFRVIQRIGLLIEKNSNLVKQAGQSGPVTKGPSMIMHFPDPILYDSECLYTSLFRKSCSSEWDGSMTPTLFIFFYAMTCSISPNGDLASESHK